ncbi:hypothetical protein Ahy_A06g026184 [Arachis hypogaea]|uniref:Complex 1 LYR protein domain-containing protein n=1 Tax=Arachis hypogaea TaxID=3818 RepID=A0A445CJM1_ARAHY|nr:hypothetical protein Ahy_A06g026184 [Arachis hypogaea]
MNYGNRGKGRGTRMQCTYNDIMGYTMETSYKRKHGLPPSLAQFSLDGPIIGQSSNNANHYWASVFADICLYVVELQASMPSWMAGRRIFICNRLHLSQPSNTNFDILNNHHHRQALRISARAPTAAKDELRQTIRQEMENNRDCKDKQRIRYLISEGMERLKRLDEMLDMQGH